MHARLIDRRLEDRHVGLEHELMDGGQQLVFSHPLAREGDQLRTGEQQCQRSACFAQ